MFVAEDNRRRLKLLIMVSKNTLLFFKSDDYLPWLAMILKNVLYDSPLKAETNSLKLIINFFLRMGQYSNWNVSKVVKHDCIQCNEV